MPAKSHKYCEGTLRKPSGSKVLRKKRTKPGVRGMCIQWSTWFAERLGLPGIKLTKDTEFGTNEATKEFLLSNPYCPESDEAQRYYVVAVARTAS